MKKSLLPLVIVVIVLIVASIAYYLLVYLPHQQGGERKVVIYTYDSLLAWGPDKNKTYDKVFKEFERRTGIKVELHLFSSGGEAVSKVIEEYESGQVRADIIIGIDPINLVKLKKKGILEPYTPPNIGEIYSWLIQSYDPDHYAIPYDYSLIAFIYDREYINDTVMENITFESFTENLGSTLVVEDPRTSTTGLNFLLYEITVYTKILHKDWREWWRTTKPHVEPGWSEAFDRFSKGDYHIMVSYGTDPAYSAFFENSTRIGAALVKYNGTPLGWLQIEGIGLIKNAPHKEEAEKFIEWFLGREVQEEIPLNNWMYPANKNVELPEVYKYAIDMSRVEVVNKYITPEEIYSNLDTWIDEWVNIMVSG